MAKSGCVSVTGNTVKRCFAFWGKWADVNLPKGQNNVMVYKCDIVKNMIDDISKSFSATWNLKLTKLSLFYPVVVAFRIIDKLINTLPHDAPS